MLKGKKPLWRAIYSREPVKDSNPGSGELQKVKVVIMSTWSHKKPGPIRFSPCIIKFLYLDTVSKFLIRVLKEYLSLTKPNF